MAFQPPAKVKGHVVLTARGSTNHDSVFVELVGFLTDDAQVQSADEIGVDTAAGKPSAAPWSEGVRMSISRGLRERESWTLEGDLQRLVGSDSMSSFGCCIRLLQPLLDLPDCRFALVKKDLAASGRILAGSREVLAVSFAVALARAVAAELFQHCAPCPKASKSKRS